MVQVTVMGARTYSTAEAAAKIGISRQTLQAWIGRDEIAAPKRISLGRVAVRLWTNADIKRARNFKGTLKRGRKPRKKN